MPSSVDVLVLGAGWTYDFLQPMLKSRNLSYAATSTSGRDETISFRFDPESDEQEPFLALPDAKTVVIVFPIYGTGGSKHLIKMFKLTHRNSKASFLQLGSTGIYDNGPTVDEQFEWTTRKSRYNKSNNRAIAEDELLAAHTDNNRTAILELCGLHGGKRNVRNFISRIAPDKETLKSKNALHMIHGQDVAQLIIAVHHDWKKIGGQRWLATDLRVYDMWELASRLGEGGLEGRDKDVEGDQAKWVRELMEEQQILGLPRTPEQLGRAQSSLELWQTLGIQPISFRTTRLPSKLQQELIETGSLRKDFDLRRASRKDSRKLSKLVSKQSKQQHASAKSKKRKAESPPFVEEEEEEKPPIKKSRVAKPKMTPLQLLAAKQSPPQPPVAVGRDAVETQEDQEIAWLEYQLNSKSGWQSKEMQDDGLDDLFADLDRLDKSLTTGSKIAFPASQAEQSSDEEDELSMADLSESDEEDSGSAASWNGITDDQDNAVPAALKDDMPTRKVRFDLPDKQPLVKPVAAVSEAYVPPHLRRKEENTSAASSLQDARLDRIIAGNMNKLSPANIRSIAQSILDVFDTATYSRALLSATIVRLMLARIAARDSQSESNLAIFAALLIMLAKGTITVLEDFMIESLRSWDAINDSEVVKTQSNIVGFWARLYIYDALGCQFIYDIIKDLVVSKDATANLTEIEAEQLLVLLKACGPKLRSDDPSSLKQIVQLVEERNTGAEISSRTKFMIETLNNLKNNRIKQADKSGLDNELQKTIKSSKSEPLRFTPEDLRQVKERGRWWHTGAAWSGDALVEATQEKNRQKSKGDAGWLKLARRQGMNTDVRQQIFIALMSSEDYVDACDRLLALKLKEVQQRQIVKVVMHCCENERIYNPFYALVLQRLLSQAGISHSFAITAQFSLWDFFRKIGESEVGGAKRISEGADDTVDVVDEKNIANLARLFGWLIGKEALSITVLKPLSFPTLGSQAVAFVSQLLAASIVATQATSPADTTITLASNRAAIKDVFGKALQNEALAQGLIFYIETHLLREAVSIMQTLYTAALDALHSSSQASRPFVDAFA